MPKKKIGIIGYGKIGMLLEAYLNSDPQYDITIFRKGDLTVKKAKKMDYLIHCADSYKIGDDVRACIEAGTNLVIVTSMDPMVVGLIRNDIENSKISAVWSSNYSVSVNVYYKLIEYAGCLIKRFGDDEPIYISDHHGEDKLDAPSGTALKMQHIVKEASETKEKIKMESHRKGKNEFKHHLTFFMKGDIINMMHQAFGRGSYITGILDALHWLEVNESPGKWHEYNPLTSWDNV